MENKSCSHALIHVTDPYTLRAVYKRKEIGKIFMSSTSLLKTI